MKICRYKAQAFLICHKYLHLFILNKYIFVCIYVYRRFKTNHTRYNVQCVYAKCPTFPASISKRFDWLWDVPNRLQSKMANGNVFALNLKGPSIKSADYVYVQRFPMNTYNSLDNAVDFPENPHNRYSIARPLWMNMGGCVGSSLWVQTLIYVMLQCCMKLYNIMYVKTVLVINSTHWTIHLGLIKCWLLPKTRSSFAMQSTHLYHRNCTS